MRKDVSIHEREEVFEVNGEDRPWVCEGQTGKGEIKKGIKRPGTSMSGVASSSSSSSSAGMMVAGGACR